MNESPNDVKAQTGNLPRRNQDPERLRRRRVAAGLTVTELAAKAGCSVPYLWQLENGDYSASAGMLGKLAGALECKITDLMDVDVLAHVKEGRYAGDARMLRAIADELRCKIADLMPPEKAVA